MGQLELEAKLIELEVGIEVYERRIGEWSREVDRLVLLKEAKIRKFRSDASAKLIEVSGRISELEHDLAIAERLVEDHTIRLLAAA